MFESDAVMVTDATGATPVSSAPYEPSQFVAAYARHCIFGGAFDNYDDEQVTMEYLPMYLSVAVVIVFGQIVPRVRNWLARRKGLSMSYAIGFSHMGSAIALFADVRT